MRHPVFCSIWDLDNCLADDEWRLRYVNRSLSGQAVWAEYNSHIPHDSAMHLDVFEAVRRAALPVFFTGRVSTYRGLTEEWIRGNLGVGLPIVYMRGLENKQSPADLKRSMLELLRRQRSEMQPVIAFDDLESIVTMYRECGVAAAVLRKYDPRQSLRCQPPLGVDVLAICDILINSVKELL